MNLPVLSNEQIEMFFLVFLRVTTVITMIPVLGDRTIPFKVKGSLALFVAFLLSGVSSRNPVRQVQERQEARRPRSSGERPAHLPPGVDRTFSAY